MKQVGVAILGSCISRDNFNSLFNANYKSYFECILFQHQTSMISLMSEKIEYLNEFEEETKLKPFDKWYFRTNYTKEFLEKIINIQPRYLIIDFFADVYYGVLEIEKNKYITNNVNKLNSTEFYKNIKVKNVRTISENFDDYFEEWKLATSRFFDFINEKCKNTKVILVKTHFNNIYVNKQGEKIVFNNSDIAKQKIQNFNFYWDTFNSYVEDKYEVEVIDLINKEKYTLKEDHPWGMFYVHYVDEYYVDFLEKLKLMVWQDMISDVSELDEYKKRINKLKSILND